MTSPYSQFKVDENIQRAGIKLDYDGYYFIITHAGQSNKKYTLKEREMIRKNRSAINTNTLTPEQDNKLMAQLYADSVILGWGSDEHGDGYLADENNNPLEFTKDNVVKILTDLPTLFQDIKTQATLVSNFRKEEAEEEAKK